MSFWSFGSHPRSSEIFCLTAEICRHLSSVPAGTLRLPKELGGQRVPSGGGEQMSLQMRGGKHTRSVGLDVERELLSLEILHQEVSGSASWDMSERFERTGPDRGG